MSAVTGRNFGQLRARSLQAKKARTFAKYGLALLLTGVLILFMVFMRWLETRRVAPDQTIRTLQGTSMVNIPAPPPPPVQAQPPAPKPPPLPKLEISLDVSVPAIKASLDPALDLQMTPPDFAQVLPQERKRMTFSMSQLDGKPRLLNRPRASFPTAMRSRGIKEGKVTLEVEITNRGQVTVLRVISSSHREFEAMARSFASQARFTPPKKDGRPVTARFQWPLILR